MRAAIGKVAGLEASRLASCSLILAPSSAIGSERDLCGSESLPASLYPALVSATQSDAPSAYDVMERVDPGSGTALAGSAYRAHNAAHRLAIEFAPEGLELRPEDGAAWRLETRLVGYGYGEDIQPVTQRARL